MVDNKYKINIPNKDIENNFHRLTNQLWKLIPMREHDEDWNKQLDTVILEITGLYVIFEENASLLQLLSKIEGLQNKETNFELYRKTIFESINLLQGLNLDVRI